MESVRSDPILTKPEYNIVYSSRKGTHDKYSCLLTFIMYTLILVNSIGNYISYL
jgi:hypothetical protein